jgi:hypothetical protein
MPHDPVDTLAIALHELAQLRQENAALRTMLIEVLRTIKEVEFALSRALDKDRI